MSHKLPLPAPSLPTISIIIPVHNGGTAFRRCLESLQSFRPHPDRVLTEVIVVADGCTDGSDRLAEAFGATVLRTPRAGGPARARNLGARQARGEVLFFVDADVTLHPDTILQVASLFQADPNLAAAIGSYDDAPGATNFLSQYKNLFHHYTHQTSQAEAFTFWGACGAIRREIFWQVGGFDQRYRRPSIEDIELGYRLKQQGYSIRLCKTLYVKHLKRWEPISLLRAEFFYRALPWTELLLQRQQMANDLNLNQTTRLSVVLTYGLILCLLAGSQGLLGLVGAGVISLLLLLLNRPVYQFFHRQRGAWFMVQTIPWHWLYFGYCGLAYGLGMARHQLRQGRSFYRLGLKPLFSTFALGR